MISIPLAAIPNQSLSIQLDTRRYEITLKAAENIMAITIKRNEILLVQGKRCTPHVLLLPSYQEDNAGNFVFETKDGDYPDYRKFDSTQSLLYVTAAELRDSRG